MKAERSALDPRKKKTEIPNRKLVWLSVNCSYSHSSLALPLLHAASVGIGGWEWSVLETTLEADRAETALELAARKPDLVCATLYLFNRDAVMEILERLHALMPECRIAVGGPECLGEGAQEILDCCPFVGTVFRGEGEEVFPEFLRTFSSGERRRQIVPEQETAIFHAWATAPSPVGDPFFRMDKPFVQLETSRGCPMNCCYCTSCGTTLRFRPPDAVRRDLEALRNRGGTEVRLLDRTFNFPEDRGVELLRLFRNEFPEIRFHLEIHPRLLGEAMRRELLAANPGQLHIEVGIQSLNARVQRAIGRSASPGEALEALRFLCRCSNFETHADLLAGLPEQSADSLFRDVADLLDAGPAEIQLEVLKVLPGTPLRSRAKELGIVFSPQPPYDVMRTESMSGAEILRFRLLSRLLDLTYNHPALHPVLRAARKESPEFLSGLLDFFLRNGLDLKRLFDLKRRFLLLADFFDGKNFDTIRTELALQWILAGYPPGTGPGMAAEKTSGIPENARLLSGSPASERERETRFLLLRRAGDTVYFALNRKYAFNRPAAVWLVRNGECGK